MCHLYYQNEGKYSQAPLFSAYKVLNNAYLSRTCIWNRSVSFLIKMKTSCQISVCVWRLRKIPDYISNICKTQIYSQWGTGLSYYLPINITENNNLQNMKKNSKDERITYWQLQNWLHKTCLLVELWQIQCNDFAMTKNRHLSEQYSPYLPTAGCFQSYFSRKERKKKVPWLHVVSFNFFLYIANSSVRF